MPSEAAPAKPNSSAPEESKITRIPGVQLDVTPGKEVILRLPGVSQSYRGKIVGFDPYDYIIAKVRLPSAVRRDLSYGGQVILKYVHKGTVYGFKANVQSAITSPASLIFFEYPDVIERLALRRTSRMNCNIDSELHATDDHVECMVVNVSETGCKIAARADKRNLIQRLKVDDALIVSMNLGNFGEMKVAIAIKNISHEKGIVSLGCMFLDITKDEMATIQGYLEKIARLTS
ncbi:flagellar brake protein [Pseudodesulfovibrio sp. zrk46]|uniref:flagellar brake protein n=1 Tax=Pseudodesulfovibrio sp. zrk46 TaxID=2725288 RepID=UPI001448ADB9|nr:flagellar brake protein [Pseudodesulfovibrio sp. zrk46]QJB55593.1 flagellar brake protein [Pseudodesulfovibrio sp. zrk46]